MTEVTSIHPDEQALLEVGRFDLQLHRSHICFQQLDPVWHPCLTLELLCLDLQCSHLDLQLPGFYLDCLISDEQHFFALPLWTVSLLGNVHTVLRDPLFPL